MMLVVTMVRKHYDDRQCRVRVTDAALRAALDETLHGRVTLSAVSDMRDELARRAAVRRWFGRHRSWVQDGIQGRGQVWQRAKFGGQDAVTEMIALRVAPLAKGGA